MTATTARKLSVRKSTVAGWEVVDGEGTVVTVAKNRDQARALAKELAGLAAQDAQAKDEAARVAEHDALAQADAQAAQERAEVEAEADVEAAEAMARVARAYELAAGVADLAEQGAEDEAWDSGEQVDPEPAVEAPKVKAPRKPRTPKAPKAEAEPAGESTVVRKLEKGQKIKLRGTGVVTIVGRVKVEKLKYLVEFEDAAGEYGSTEMWANARYRLIG